MKRVLQVASDLNTDTLRSKALTETCARRLLSYQGKALRCS